MTDDSINPLERAFMSASNTPPPVDATPETVTSPEMTPFEALAAKYKEIPDADPPANATPETPVTDDKFPDAESLSETLKTPEAKAKWNELRSEKKAFETKVKEYEAKVAEYETKLAEASKLAVSTELENKVKSYEEQVQKYEQELAISRVEATKEYKELVSSPTEAIMSAAESLAKHYKIDEQKLADALIEGNTTRQNALLEDLMDGMSERDRSRLYRLADDMGMVVAKDAELRERASTAWEEAQSRMQAETEASERNRLLTLKNATEKVFELFGSKKLDAYGVDLNSVKEAALSSDIDRAAPEVRAYASAAGNMLPTVLKALADKEARIKSLEETVAKYNRATPGASAGTASGTAEGSTNPVAKFLFGGS